MNQKKQLIVIEGPTASGKTALGIALAKKLETIIISADSRQFYKEIAIGTAKPSLEEQNGVKHYFIDSHNIEDEISSAKYAKEANNILKNEFENHDTILMVGGSGMFIDAVCIGLDPIPKSDEIKKQLNLEFEKKGIEPLLEELKRSDIDYYNEVDKGNPMRIIRALEVIRYSGKTFSSQRTKTPPPPFFDVKRFVINHSREKIYERINLRVDQMIEKGLIEEVKSIFHLKHLTTLKTVGYTEIFNYLDGTTDLKTAIDLIKQNTRRYAKRQLTWFRRHPEAIWLKNTDTELMVKEIEVRLQDARQ